MVSELHNKDLSDLWTFLIIVGFVIFITGMFLLVEASGYTSKQVGTIIEFDGERVTVGYLNNEYQLSGNINNSVVINEDGTVDVLTMPKNPSNAVFSIAGEQTAGYILISIGGAMLITFMFTRIFV